MATSAPFTGKRKRDALDETDDRVYNGFMDDETEPHKFGTAVLPVANLPDSFDGVPMNGMEYLFTVRREQRLLPFVTRVHNPYATNYSMEPSPLQNEDYSVKTRIPLPTEEWRLRFTERFRNFRKNLQQPTIHVSIPRSTTVLRIPEMQERDKWWAFFRGDVHWEKVPSSQVHAKKHVRSDRIQKEIIDYNEELSNTKGKMRAWVVYDEPLSWDQGDETADQDHGTSIDSCDTEDKKNLRGNVNLEVYTPRKDEVNDVTAANFLPTPCGSPSPQATTTSFNPTVYEGSTPREPTPHILNLLDQKMTFRLLRYFTSWIRAHFDCSVIPAPPPILGFNSDGRESHFYDLTPTHARWIFVLLSRLDSQLTSEDISVLRDLAREVMKVIKEEVSARKALYGSPSVPSMGEVPCWMIVATIAGVWGQTDLWMDAEEALR